MGGERYLSSRNAYLPRARCICMGWTKWRGWRGGEGDRTCPPFSQKCISPRGDMYMHRVLLRVLRLRPPFLPIGSNLKKLSFVLNLRVFGGWSRRAPEGLFSLNTLNRPMRPTMPIVHSSFDMHTCIKARQLSPPTTRQVRRLDPSRSEFWGDCWPHNGKVSSRAVRPCVRIRS